MTLMNNREQIEQSVISTSAYNGNDTEGLLKEIEDVYKKARAFDEILEGLPNAMQDALKEDIYLDEAVGIMTGQVVYKYEEEQEMSDKSNSEIIKRVLETSKSDINIWDVLSEFDSEQEEEILDFIDENIEEFEIFLNTALIHIVERLKLRIAFATAREAQEND